MPLSVQELVEAAMKACRATTPTELATAMGLGPWSPQKIKRWLEGENAPTYDATIALLETAGLLRAGTTVVRRPASPPDPLGALAESVAELAATQALIADALGVPRAAVAPAEVPPSRKRAAPRPKG